MNGKEEDRDLRVCIIGSGTTFISGVSYYSFLLTDALSQRFTVSVILMRRLIPRVFYPGRPRVGAPISDLHTSQIVPTFDGIDWFLIPSLFRARRFLRSQRPDVLILQWWTGAVALSYLALIRSARQHDARVILEFHEDQDTGEAALPLIGRIVAPLLRRIIARADGYVVHSDWDRCRLAVKFGLDPSRVVVIHHGPYPMAAIEAAPRTVPSRHDERDTRRVTILYFGVIRPYKGVEDLVEAFSLLPRAEGTCWTLLVVGETWEGWSLPAEKISSSPFACDIEFVNRYVPDSELPGIFAQADLVVLPYRRSSASGPLHLTMSCGLPVVVSGVGGLPEAAAGYSGAVFVRPEDPEDLAAGIIRGVELIGTSHADVQSWDATAERYADLCLDLSGKEETGSARVISDIGQTSAACDLRVARR